MPRSYVHQRFAEEIAAWFARRKRTLPWRDLQIPDDTQRAYMILVSEVMLQQTQVPRVQILFKKFLERFPAIQELAAASNKDVLLEWRGLGYNSRALRLRDAAKIIVEQHAGVFPREMEELLAIKGIGAYTAAAIRNFAFNLPTPCIDTNIRRILHRVFVGPETREGEWMSADKDLLKLAGGFIEGAKSGKRKTENRKPSLSASHSQLSPSAWHAALMDFGSLTCTKRSPKCAECPMQSFCKSAFHVPQLERGAAKKKERLEPGREIAGRYVPNRIIRGRIVEALRDAPQGLTLHQIGPMVCVDWNAETHLTWLKGLVDVLMRDGMLLSRGGAFVLHE